MSERDGVWRMLSESRYMAKCMAHVGMGEVRGRGRPSDSELRRRSDME